MSALGEMAAEIYGGGWQSRMARHLDLPLTNVGRWARGEVTAEQSSQLRLLLKLLDAFLLLGLRYDPDIDRLVPREDYVCRGCGVTDDDCCGCADCTGERWYWVEKDLCSECFEERRFQS